MRAEQDRQNRQVCKVCRQNKPLSQYGRHNGRYRRECEQCRWIRKFRAAEQSRVGKARTVIRRLVRQSQRGQLDTASARKALQELVEHTGSIDAAAQLWRDNCREIERQKPNGIEGLHHLGTLVELSRIAEEADAAQTATRDIQCGSPSRPQAATPPLNE